MTVKLVMKQDLYVGQDDPKLASETVNSEVLARIDTSIADSTTDEEHILAIDVSQIDLVWMTSDKALTIKTNSSSSPQETITLAANQVKSQIGTTNPLFSADVTKLFITNASGAAAAFVFVAGTTP